MFGRFASNGIARAAPLHVERVGDAHDPGLERERIAAAAVADDRVQRLRGEDRARGLVVDVLEQAVELPRGEEQAVGLVVGAVDGHARVVEERGGGYDHLGVLRREPVVASPPPARRCGGSAAAAAEARCSSPSGRGSTSGPTSGAGRR